MRYRWIAPVLFLLLLLLTTPCAALDGETLLRRQEQAAGIDELERAGREAGGSAQYGQELDEGLRALRKEGEQAAGGILRKALRSGVMLLVVVMACGLGQNLYEVSGRNNIPVTSLAGTLAVAAISMGDVSSMLGLGVSTMENIASFSNVLLPVTAAVTAATGSATGAAVRHLAAAVFSDLLMNLIRRLLLPILYAYLALVVAHSALGNDGLKRISAVLKWVVVTVLTTIMLAFVGYLSVSGIVSGTTDAAAVKAAKFAISGAIPVVGKILSDAAETILASAGVLRGTVGVFGTLTILSICLIPVLKLAIHYLVYKLASALSATVGPAGISTLVDQIGSAFALMLGMMAACALLLLIVLLSSVTAVSL